MRVLLIDFNFFEYTTSLANALARQIQVSLLVPNNYQSVADALLPKVDLIYFNKPRLRSVNNLKMLAKIQKTINYLRPEVIHLVAVNPWLYAWFALRKPPYLVTTIHDPVMHAGDRSQKNIPQSIRDLPLKFSRQLIVHGQALKEVLLSKHNIAPKKISAMPIGELSIYTHWSKQPWPEKEGSILFFGRIWPYKGLDYLIAAEPAISAACPQARFVIAGRGESLDRYRAMMTHPERFEIRNDFIPLEDVSKLFQQASVVVLPYTEASQSAVIPLAYAFGKPVVATTVGGIPEVVTHGQDGLLVPPRDSNALAQAVISLLQDPSTRHTMGQSALKKTKNQLSWTTIAEQTVQVYRQILAR